ncbi:MAG: hypothetical protein HY719_05230 [Planctomycetes bacterium]|nr:hypothetical protein [Planctomycetota bacterium]
MLDPRHSWPAALLVLLALLAAAGCNGESVRGAGDGEPPARDPAARAPTPLADEVRAEYARQLAVGDDAGLLVSAATPLVAAAGVDPASREVIEGILAPAQASPAALAVLTALSNPSQAEQAPLFLRLVIAFLDPGGETGGDDLTRGVRARAVAVVRAAPRKEAAPLLREATRPTERAALRIQAIQALALLHALEVAQDGTLIDYLAPGTDPAVRRAAHRALVDITGYELGAPQAEWRRWQAENGGKSPEQYTQGLLAEVRDRIRVRDRIIAALTAEILRGADRDRVEKLALDSELPDDARALALDALVDRLRSRPPDAADGDALVARLKPLLAPGNTPALRERALAALSCAGPAAAPLLREVLATESDEALRLATVRALGGAGDRETLILLGRQLDAVSEQQVPTARETATALARVAAALRDPSAIPRLRGAGQRIADESFQQTLFQAFQVVLAASGGAASEYRGEVALYMVDGALAPDLWGGRGASFRMDAVKYVGEMGIGSGAGRLRAIAADPLDPAAGPALVALAKVAAGEDQTRALALSLYARPAMRGFGLEALETVALAQPAHAVEIVQGVDAHDSADALRLAAKLQQALPREQGDLLARLRHLEPQLTVKTAQWRGALDRLAQLVADPKVDPDAARTTAEACLRNAFLSSAGRAVSPERGPALLRAVRLANEKLGRALEKPYLDHVQDLRGRDFNVFVDVVLHTRSLALPNGPVAGFGPEIFAALPEPDQARVIDRATDRAVHEPPLRPAALTLLKEMLRDDSATGRRSETLVRCLEGDDRDAAAGALEVLSLLHPARPVRYTWSDNPDERRAAAENVRAILGLPRRDAAPPPGG